MTLFSAGHALASGKTGQMTGRKYPVDPTVRSPSCAGVSESNIAGESPFMRVGGRVGLVWRCK